MAVDVSVITSAMADVAIVGGAALATHIAIRTWRFVFDVLEHKKEMRECDGYRKGYIRGDIDGPKW